jgi:hypothetical protein
MKKCPFTTVPHVPLHPLLKRILDLPLLSIYIVQHISCILLSHNRELAFFFPDFAAPTVINKRKKKRLQRTLALIRPDALRTRKGTLT